MAMRLTPNQELGLLLASMGMPNDTGLTPEQAFEIGDRYFKQKLKPEPIDRKNDLIITDRLQE